MDQKLTCFQGTSDVVYSIANAKEEIKLFTNSSDARLVIIPDGQHFLSFSHPEEVDSQLVEFVGKYAKEDSSFRSTSKI